MKLKRKKGIFNLIVTFVLLFSMTASSLAMADTLGSDGQIDGMEGQEEDMGEESILQEPTVGLPEESSVKPSIEPTKEPLEGLINPKDEEVGEEQEVSAIQLQASEEMEVMQTSSHEYDPNDDFEVIVLTGATSNNGHTQAKWLWMEDGYLYMAVASTHGIRSLTVNGVTALEQGNGQLVDGTHSVIVHNIHDTITITGFGTHKPQDYVNGNKQDARWSIVRFFNPYVLLNLLESGNTIGSTSVAGEGHNIGSGTKFSVNIPYVSAILNKIWKSGPGGSVDVDLFTSNNGGENWNEEPYATVTLNPVDQGDGTFKATHNWGKLPYTDTLGRRLTYKAEEADPGESYVPIMEVDFDKVKNHYTFTLINTYQPSVAIIKEVTGNFGDLTREFDFTAFYRSSGNQELVKDIFTLQDDGTKILTNLQPNNIIKLKEDNVPDGYIVTVELDNGIEADFDEGKGYYIIEVGEEDLTITVKNHKDVIIATGIYTDSLPYITILSLVIVAFSVLVFQKRKEKTNTDRRE